MKKQAFLMFKIFLIYKIIQFNFCRAKVISRNNKNKKVTAEKLLGCKKKIEDVIASLKQIDGESFISFIEDNPGCLQSGLDYTGVYGACYYLFSPALCRNIISLNDGMAKINFDHCQRISSDGESVLTFQEGNIVYQDAEFLVFVNSVFGTAAPTEESFEKNTFEN